MLGSNTLLTFRQQKNLGTHSHFGRVESSIHLKFGRRDEIEITYMLKQSNEPATVRILDSVGSAPGSSEVHMLESMLLPLSSLAPPTCRDVNSTEEEHPTAASIETRREMEQVEEKLSHSHLGNSSHMSSEECRSPIGLDCCSCCLDLANGCEPESGREGHTGLGSPPSVNHFRQLRDQLHFQNLNTDKLNNIMRQDSLESVVRDPCFLLNEGICNSNIDQTMLSILLFFHRECEEEEKADEAVLVMMSS
ncbi:hypothetical protein DNTS_009417 [Danionella cerebrum]|uniref:Uncharacterized protein n=1 Tax=Danionella cerebrum TaxID=2873325 RepID=A0A553NIA1_9TELE|nr:hypothetical protein DNTS_009417 [Danionella translucida]